MFLPDKYYLLGYTYLTGSQIHITSQVIQVDMSIPAYTHIVDITRIRQATIVGTGVHRETDIGDRWLSRSHAGLRRGLGTSFCCPTRSSQVCPRYLHPFYASSMWAISACLANTPWCECTRILLAYVVLILSYWCCLVCERSCFALNSSHTTIYKSSSNFMLLWIRLNSSAFPYSPISPSLLYIEMIPSLLYRNDSSPLFINLFVKFLLIYSLGYSAL